jgi:hypothetical protein
MQNFAIADLRPLCTSVTVGRLHVASDLLAQYPRAQAPPFAPLELRYDGAIQLVLPPVVLAPVSGSEAPVVLDGMHRLAAARDTGLTIVEVLAIDDPQHVLAGTPVTWADVSRLSTQPRVETKFRDFNPAGFTAPFTRCLNDEWLWKRTTE